MTSTLTPSAVRTLDGVELPVAGTWDIDPGHAEVAFTGRHFMITKVRGTFPDVRGSVVVGADPADSRLDVVIGMGSVSTGNPARDEHLRSAELFDVERWPEATFRSVSVAWHGTTGVVLGDLTIHGVTRRVTIPLQVQMNGDRAEVVGSHTFPMSDFGITPPNVANFVTVEPEATLEFQLFLTRE